MSWEQLELFGVEQWTHPFEYGGKWANECKCGAHWLAQIHDQDWDDLEEVVVELQPSDWLPSD